MLQYFNNIRFTVVEDSYHFVRNLLTGKMTATTMRGRCRNRNNTQPRLRTSKSSMTSTMRVSRHQQQLRHLPRRSQTTMAAAGNSSTSGGHPDNSDSEPCIKHCFSKYSCTRQEKGVTYVASERGAQWAAVQQSSLSALPSCQYLFE